MLKRRVTVFVAALLLLIIAFPAHAQDAAAPEGEPVIHVVQRGDTLYHIALRYGVSVEALVTANNITNTARILAGDELIIPGLTLPTTDADTVQNPLIAGTPQTHIVQAGETLQSIANRYDITLEQLMRANSIANPNLIYRGQALTVWTTDSVSVAATAEEYIHTVQPGETLSNIARRYGVNWQDIANVNGISNVNRVEVGAQLVIPGVVVESPTPNIVPPVADMGIVNGLDGAPLPVDPLERHIIVDLSDSRVYAYENGQVIYSVLGSMGLPATPTVTGDFRIYHRLESQTMSGPGYYLPGVQYVQYFYQGYALHGAYWHNNWGQPMSHGCVNLPNEAAEWLYNFADYGMLVRVQY